QWVLRGGQVFRSGAQSGVAHGVGAELTLAGAEMDPHAADPAGDHLLVLARGAGGYRRLSRVMALGHLSAGKKRHAAYHLHELGEEAGGEWQILTGCRKGAVRRALGAGPREWNIS